MNLIVGEELRLNARKYPDKIAVVFKDKRISYQELNLRANKLANGLLNLGLKRGDGVAILLDNCLEYPEIYCGLAKAGLIMVPINFRLVSREIEYIINNSDARALIVGQEFIERIESIWQNLKKIKRENCIYLGEPEKTQGLINYEQFLAQSSDKEPGIKVKEKDIFFIAYTSGTTGFPKGALRTHRADMMNVLISALELGFSPDTATLLVMPLFHCNSVWFGLSTLSMGGKIVIHPSGSFNPIEILQIIEKEKVTFTSLVPTHYTLILNLPDEEKKKYEISSIKTLLCSSAPLMTKTKEEIIRFFSSAQLYEAYGAAELGMITLLRPKDQLRKRRCVGQPIFGAEVKILDEKGRELPQGKIGEFYIKTRALLKEYYKNPEATQKATLDEWFSVGDMGKVDEEGYFYLVDRKNDMIISGGENIYPTEVEEVISKHPKVKEVAVVGIPDEKWGEKVLAAIVLKEGEESTAEEIIDFCRDKLAGYKKPKSVDFVPDLPKTSTGKILRRQVREKYSVG